MNILVSFYYIKDPEVLIRLQEAGGNVLLDSGAYSRYAAYERADTTKSELVEGMSKYCDEYLTMLERVDGKISGYFTLDLAGDSEVSEKYQKKIEARGLNPIPVYHGDCKESERIKSFCEGYGYVGVPASSRMKNIKATTNYDKKRLANFIRNAGGAKVHLLGTSNLSTIKALCPHSSDSANHIDFWQPTSDIKIYNRRQRKWYKLHKSHEEWSNIKAIHSFFDIVGYSSISDIKDQLKDQGRFNFRIEQIAKNAGWFNFSTWVSSKGLTNMHSSLIREKQIAAAAWVGKEAGWLDSDFYDWIISK